MQKWVMIHGSNGLLVAGGRTRVALRMANRRELQNQLPVKHKIYTNSEELESEISLTVLDALNTLKSGFTALTGGLEVRPDHPPVRNTDLGQTIVLKFSIMTIFNMNMQSDVASSKCLQNIEVLSKP